MKTGMLLLSHEHMWEPFQAVTAPPSSHPPCKTTTKKKTFISSSVRQMGVVAAPVTPVCHPSCFTVTISIGHRCYHAVLECHVAVAMDHCAKLYSDAMGINVSITGTICK